VPRQEHHFIARAHSCHPMADQQAQLLVYSTSCLEELSPLKRVATKLMPTLAISPATLLPAHQGTSPRPNHATPGTHHSVVKSPYLRIGREMKKERCFRKSSQVAFRQMRGQSVPSITQSTSQGVCPTSGSDLQHGGERAMLKAIPVSRNVSVYTPPPSRAG
jgi:hypothetical protein